jgi:hypothetical protein
MPGKFLYFAAGVFACASFAQSQTETFCFKYGDTNALNQFIDVMKIVGEMQAAISNASGQSIAVSGTPDQLARASWLARELNQAPGGRPALTRHDYAGAVPQNQEVHVYYLAHIDSPSAIKEIVNLTRSAAEVQRAAPCAALNAIALRATPAEAEGAGWLFEPLDRPAGTMPASYQNHPGPADSRPSTVQIYMLTNTDTPQSVQEIIKATRSISNIQRFFPYFSRKALVLRGSSEQVAFVDWVLGLLDKPASAGPIDTATHEYQFSDYPMDKDIIARVFYWNVSNPQQLQQIVNDVRTSTSMQRIFPNNQVKAIAMRGTGEQIARAEEILKNQ